MLQASHEQVQFACDTSEAYDLNESVPQKCPFANILEKVLKLPICIAWSWLAWCSRQNLSKTCQETALTAND